MINNYPDDPHKGETLSQERYLVLVFKDGRRWSRILLSGTDAAAAAQQHLRSAPDIKHVLLVTKQERVADVEEVTLG